jgi:hypothetical protein
MNSDKMRSTYGKLLHILQDTNGVDALDFRAIIPITTVSSFLSEKGANGDLLSDSDFRTACAELAVDSRKEDLQDMYREKAAARARVVANYASDSFTADDIERCIDSMSDHNSHLVSNRHPVDRMIEFLQRYFQKEEKSTNLSIQAGYNGSKLTHDHNTQFTFVLQSLTLWREVMHDLFHLWICSDADMLDDCNLYHLRNTGQGLNRMQSAPRVSKKMHEILHRAQAKVGLWVGLSVVHLGDRDVPNALFFIDKYTQVPRILSPLVSVIDRLDELAHHDDIREIVIEGGYGGVENLKKQILRDFFRSGFDGSGSDGGSCVDGRLTSAWNWCSKLEKKPFWPVFLLCDFQGFDGDFKK